MYGNITYNICFVRKYYVHLLNKYKIMATLAKKNESSRIEFRVSNEDKELFEHASSLRGYRSFSEFARIIISKEAKAIVSEEKQILASKRDREIFFNALMGKEEKPNQALISAIKYHNELTK